MKVLLIKFFFLQFARQVTNVFVWKVHRLNVVFIYIVVVRSLKFPQTITVTTFVNLSSKCLIINMS